ncbi:hypothetical protein TNCV_270591 [Trichonephila clavipes]|nr:hypothetical protein TNCV_270591 [Trichonephila clavipes]
MDKPALYLRAFGGEPRILNHGQVTAPPFPNYHTTPTGERLSSRIFNAHRSPTWWVFSGTKLELMIRRPRVRYLDH